MHTADTSAPSDDPRPLAPPAPGDFACCQSGCEDSCVWSIHEDAMRDYRKRLAAWLARHPQAPGE